MKHLLLIVIFTLSAMGFCKAQNRVFLTLDGGAGYGLYRDLGTSPITYRGLEAATSLGVAIEGENWRAQAIIGGEGGGYGLKPGFATMQHYGSLPCIALSAMRKTATNSVFDLWLGAQAEEMMDIRYSASLGNTALSFSNFVNISLLARAEYRLGKLRFHTQFTFALPSLCLRPGFAYLDNFNQDISNPSTNTFDQYQWYLTGMNAIFTQLGASYTLPNGNRIGLAYHWHYLTSRTSPTLAPYRFEQASHTAMLHFDFLLN